MSSQKVCVREPCVGRGTKQPMLFAEEVNVLSAINKNININCNNLHSQVKEAIVPKEE